MTRYADFDKHGRAALVLDAVYAGGRAKNIGADPISKLLPVGNQGGFRYNGSPEIGKCNLVVLFTTGEVDDWPDSLDARTGLFSYYGDNREPGRQLHDTKRGGNKLLRDMFEALHDASPRRDLIPPILVFQKSGDGRDVLFRGLAVPGGMNVAPMDDLVAVWKSKGSDRFQNYRATFTILDVPDLTRTWLDRVLVGDRDHRFAPAAWADWVRTGRYRPLQTAPIRTFRTREEQLPTDSMGTAMLEVTYAHFKGRPHLFEHCAGKLWEMSAKGATIEQVTRKSMDGGRDALGRLALGPLEDPISLKFALEAKCYARTNGATVRDTSRLISRLRHREFGVFVTTSFVNSQAYRELRDDGHPVVVMAGGDIVSLLRRTQISGVEQTRQWLGVNFRE